MTRAIAVCLSLFMLCTPALAKDTPQSIAADARKLAGQGETLKAAERFGEAIALAHSTGDLEAEQEVAETMNADLTGATTRGTDLLKLAPLLAAALKKLDANRCGACVSAPVLARTILEIATETGDFGSVAAAAPVAAAHTIKKGSGLAAPVVAKYAEGLLAVAEGRFAPATVILDVAATNAAAAGWMDLATYAATEAAAAWVKTGNTDMATASLAAVASAVNADSSWCVSDWARLVRARLASAPPAVRKPVDDLVAKFPGGRSPGAGAPGGRAGSVLPIRNVLKDFAKGKPIVKVKSTSGGWEIDWPTSKEPAFEMRNDTHRFVEEGGLALALDGHHVAFARIDLAGGKAGLGGGRDALRAYYLVAQGETWGVSKDGIVSITR